MDAEHKLREKELAVQRLEHDRRYLADREKEERQAKAQLVVEHDALRAKLTAEMAALRSSLSLLQEFHADLQNTHSQLSLSSAAALDTEKASAAVLAHRNSALQSSLEQVQSLAADRLSQIHRLQDELEHHEPSHPDHSDDHHILAAELKQLTQHLRKLESDNTDLSAELVALRSSHQATEVLREQIRSLEAKAAHTDSLRQQLAQLQVPPPPLPPPPPSIPPDNQALASLRLEHTDLLDKHGSTLAALHALQNQHTHLQSQLASAQSHIDELTQNLDHEKDARRKQDAQTDLFQREISFLKDLIASYQTEETDETTLLKLFNDYKSLSTSHPQYQSLLDRIDQLEQQLFDLQGEVAAGRHVPPNTRVLQLADNPEKQWFDLRQQTIDDLKQENKALLDRLTAHAPDPSSLIPPQSYTSLQSSLSDLQSQLAQKQKRLLRLEQIFHSKASEFREAVAAILGVKLAFYPNGQVRVTSIFDLNASFVFQPGSTATEMQLVAQGEGGPQDLPNLMAYWIEKEQCPPGFIASLTLECYEKGKMR